MPRILLVKTSSLGDVVHNLPVVSDIRSAVPDAEIHWVVEEAFATIPRMHSGVSTVLPVALRRWRKSLFARDTRSEIESFMHALRGTRYDAIIDTQGIFKSALIARTALGRRYGLDWKGSREPLFLFYDKTFEVPRGQHAVERNRSLAAQALAYTIPPGPHYAISAPRANYAWLTASVYAVLIHATSDVRKLWAEDRWISLGNALAERGVRVVLPWGTEEEQRRSERLARGIPGAVTPPRLDLPDVASVISQARYAIGVDTGLTHLAGALGVATVGIYTATDTASTGLHGCARGVNVGGRRAIPSREDVMRELQRLAS